MYYSPCKMWIPPIVVVRKVGIVVELVAWRGLHLSIILILSKAHNLKPLFCLITYPIFKKIKHIIVSYFIFHYVTINSLLAGRTSYIRSSFTSHYVTINSAAFCAISRSLSSFTSHYVTINSDPVRFRISPLTPFTSHYVTINSTVGVEKVNTLMLFTFHYVTINSSPTRANLLSHLNLHPTM
mgnify:CR=1 FL=1